jgi:hypothetical protein
MHGKRSGVGPIEAGVGGQTSATACVYGGTTVTSVQMLASGSYVQMLAAPNVYVYVKTSCSGGAAVIWAVSHVT